MINGKEIIDWGRYKGEPYDILKDYELRNYVSNIIHGYKMNELDMDIQLYFLYIYQDNLNYGYKVRFE